MKFIQIYTNNHYSCLFYNNTTLSLKQK